MRRPALVSALLPVLLLGGCGYQVGGKANLIPSNVRTIAVPAFTNVTTRYKLTERLPSAITREFLTRTRYRIVADPNEADAILNGAVVNFMSAPTVFDQASGRAAGIQVMVFLNLTLVDKSTGNILFRRDNLEVRERYEISADPKAYFDESEVGLERLSQQVARQVVSSVLEAF